MHRSWLYTLRSCDGSYYTGCTTNLEERIAQHDEGLIPGYTADRLLVELMWNIEFSSINDALSAERQAKGWSRKKKEALMRGDFDLLHELSQSKEMRKRRARRREK